MISGREVSIGLVTFFAIMVSAMLRKPRIDVAVDGQELVIEPRGLDVLWTLRRHVRVPLAQVRGVAVAPLAGVPREGLRLPGAALPGVIRAGSYGMRPRRDFWDVRRAEEILWLDLAPEAGAPYRRLILQVEDPRQTATQLRPLVGPTIPVLAV
ncbi:MAG: hypothetical protein ACQSGP_08480 [Frankia sp.]